MYTLTIYIESGTERCRFVNALCGHAQSCPCSCNLLHAVMSQKWGFRTMQLCAQIVHMWRSVHAKSMDIWGGTCFCVLCSAVAGQTGSREGSLRSCAVRVTVLSHSQQRAKSPLPWEPVSAKSWPLRGHLPINLQSPEESMQLVTPRHVRQGALAAAPRSRISRTINPQRNLRGLVENGLWHQCNPAQKPFSTLKSH